MLNYTVAILKGSFFPYTTSVNTEALRLIACLSSELVETHCHWGKCRLCDTLHVLALDKC
jgi:hypothetical protein